MEQLANITNTDNMTPIEVALRMDKDGYVSAKNLYDFLELDKSSYARWCKTNIVENPFSSENEDYRVFVMCAENPLGGRPSKEYLLSAAFAKKLSMQAGGEKAEQARNYFIWCEDKLKLIAQSEKTSKEIRAEAKQQWELERSKGILMRHILTDTIKMKIADSPNKRFAYPNYTKLIYQTIFGKPLKELQDEHGVKSKESIREYLTAEQLKEVESVEMLVSSLINLGMGYQEIKDFISVRYIKQLSA